MANRMLLFISTFTFLGFSESALSGLYGRKMYQGSTYVRSGEMEKQTIVICTSKEAAQRLKEHRRTGGFNKENLPAGCQNESISKFILFEKIDSQGIHFNYFEAHVLRHGGWFKTYLEYIGEILFLSCEEGPFSNKEEALEECRENFARYYR